MKTNKTSTSLIIIGIILIAFAQFNYASFRNTASAGTTTETKTEEKPFQWSPLVGLVLLIGGILFIDPKSSARA